MMKQLAEVFEQPSISKIKGAKALDHLNRAKLLNSVEKQEEPHLAPETFRDMINLDVLTHRVLQKSKNGLSKGLGSLSIKDITHEEYYTTQIPEYYPIMDVRQPADVYVESKLDDLISDLFEMRAKVETKMTRAELHAFDKVLAKHLQKDRLMPKLAEAIQRDYSFIEISKTIVNNRQDKERSDAL